MAFQAANGTQLGRHLVKNVGRKWRGVGVMDYHHWKSPSSPWSRMLIPHSILPNHTEGHRLNGRDALSRKAGLRLGKDSAGVGVKNLLGQSSLKYCRRRGLNRCPLAWELGTLPLDQLDLIEWAAIVRWPASMPSNYGKGIKTRNWSQHYISYWWVLLFLGCAQMWAAS